MLSIFILLLYLYILIYALQVLSIWVIFIIEQASGYPEAWCTRKNLLKFHIPFYFIFWVISAQMNKKMKDLTKTTISCSGNNFSLLKQGD